MERVEGDVVTERVPAALDTPDERRRIGEELDRRARRDPRRRLAGGRARGLRQADRLPRAPAAPLPRPVGAQQDARDPRRRDASATWLASNMPESGAGDDRPRRLPAGQHDVRRRRARAAASRCFDWEMATIGDPLADVGYLCMLWVDRDDPPRRHVRAVGAVTRGGGLPAARRARRALRGAHRALDDATSAGTTTLALWKSIVFMEGNYKRAVAGTTDDPFLKDFGEGVLELAQRAEAIALWRLSAERRPARRLRRRADDERLRRPSRRFCEPRACSPTTRARRVPRRTRRRASCCSTSSSGAIAEERVRAALRRARSGCPRTRRGPHRAAVRRDGARPGDDRRRARGQARAGVRTGLISNSWGATATTASLFAELFDGVVISGEEGIRKPDPAIYELGARAHRRCRRTRASSSTTCRQPQAGAGAGHGDRPPHRRRRRRSRARGAARACRCAGRVPASSPAGDRRGSRRLRASSSCWRRSGSCASAWPRRRPSCPGAAGELRDRSMSPGMRRRLPAFPGRLAARCRPRSSAPRPAATARAARRSSSATPRAAGEVEQLLALLALARRAQEQPAEQARASAIEPSTIMIAPAAVLVGERADVPVRASPAA